MELNGRVQEDIKRLEEARLWFWTIFISRLKNEIDLCQLKSGLVALVIPFVFVVDPFGSKISS
jgi:hypothetical protein